MDDASLVFGFWEQFSHRLQHTKALVPNDEFYSIQAAVAQPLKKADSAGLVLFYALTQNLPLSVLIDRNRHQYGHVFVLSSPIPAQIDAIHVDIRVLSALQRTVSPVLDVDIRLLVQFADCGR